MVNVYENRKTLYSPSSPIESTINLLWHLIDTERPGSISGQEIGNILMIYRALARGSTG